MARVDRPEFLVIEVPDLVAARGAFAALAAPIAAGGGVLLAAALPRDVQVLEAGPRTRSGS
jgi:hypothetical protein